MQLNYRLISFHSWCSSVYLYPSLNVNISVSISRFVPCRSPCPRFLKHQPINMQVRKRNSLLIVHIYATQASSCVGGTSISLTTGILISRDDNDVYIYLCREAQRNQLEIDEVDRQVQEETQGDERT